MINKRNLIIFLFLVILIVIIILAISKITKNIAVMSGTRIAIIAEWNFKLNRDTSTTSKIILNETLVNNQVKTQEIMPNTKGSFKVSIDGAGSNKSIKYTMTISELNNLPNNFKFYFDSDCTKPLLSINNEFKVEQIIPIEKINSPVINTYYWKWDSEESSKQFEEPPQFLITITGVQI